MGVSMLYCLFDGGSAVSSVLSAPLVSLIIVEILPKVVELYEVENRRTKSDI